MLYAELPGKELTMVQTVTGPCKAEELGRTLVHEHFFFGYPGYEAARSHPGCVTREEILDTALRGAQVLKAQGYQTVLDATPNDCGRDPVLLREIAERTGLRILCATGYYASGKSAPGYWDFRIKHGDASAEYAELLTQELIEGISGTGIRAGFIKCATGYGPMTDMESHLLRGAALAQQRTGAVIYTHTENGVLAEEQVQTLLDAGVDPAHCVIGHLCGEHDLNKLLRILQEGFYIGFDRLGSIDEKRPSVAATMSRIQELADRGYKDRIVLSQDTVLTFLGLPFRPDWKNHYFGYLAETYLPALSAEYGVSAEMIETMLTSNPCRLFQ